MKKFTSVMLVFGLALGLAACGSASKSEQAALDQKVSSEVPVRSPEQMLSRAAASFSNIEGLTTEEKMKLTEVYTNTYVKSMDIRKEIGQSKSLLFKTLAKKDYKDSEINALKKKIVQLDQNRLDLMFKTLDDVQKIVGKNTPASQKIYEHLERYDYPMVREQYQ